MPLDLGRGISLRRSFLTELSVRLAKGDRFLKTRLDWVELVPENFMGRGGETRRALLQIAEILPVALHGVTLSIGSADPLDWEYLKTLKRLSRDLKARWATDHISYSSVDGVQFHNLLPLPLTEEALAHVSERARQVQDFLEIPFGLENPSYYREVLGAEMPEAEFISRLLEESGCQLLLDVNNIYVNCYNQLARATRTYPATEFKEDGLQIEQIADEALQLARGWLCQLPLQRVMEIHVAGHDWTQVGGQRRLLDTHGTPVPESVQVLLEDFHRQSSLKTLLLERERDVPSLDELVEEVSRIWERARFHVKSHNTFLEFVC